MKNILACGFIEKKDGEGHAFPALPPERFAAVGIHNVEIFWHDGLTVDGVREMLAPHGIAVTSLRVPCPLQDDGVFDVFEQFAARAVALDCKRLYASVQPKDMPEDKVCQRLARIGDVLQKHDLVLGMETNMPLCHNAEAAMRTIEAVNHPCIRLNFDTGNIYYYNENVDAVAELKTLANYVSSVHLKDTTGAYRESSFPVLGEGIVDFPAVFEALADVGFHGPYTIELEGQMVLAHLDTQENVAGTLKACVDYLKEQGLV